MNSGAIPNGYNRRGFLALASAGVGAAAMCPAAAIAGPPVASSRLSGSWIPTKQFLETLPGLMRLACLPGLSMAVMERGEVIWAQTFGVLNSTTKEPVREDTLFEAASMSKPPFAYTVLRLAEEKAIDLDRPLVAYYRPAYLPRDPNIDLITARHVLTHTSGLPDWGEEGKSETLRPMFKPGRYLSYSGEGFVWLQFTIEKITGLGLDACVRSRLFKPAGMTHST